MFLTDDCSIVVIFELHHAIITNEPTANTANIVPEKINSFYQLTKRQIVACFLLNLWNGKA